MLDPEKSWLVMQFSRADIVEYFNDTLGREEFRPDDDRLTDAVCEDFANQAGLETPDLSDVALDVMHEFGLKKPGLTLLGKDGNALAILGAAQEAARDAGWDQARIRAFMGEAMAGDYNHLLRTCAKHFEVE